MASRSSLNYDVDIVHPAEVHHNLRERAPLKYWQQIKDDIETIVLKWSSFSYDPDSKNPIQLKKKRTNLTEKKKNRSFRLLRYVFSISIFSS